MKSYLSLIPISAKVHKRQNRMTILCIIISVFLVTVIFSLSDMMQRAEMSRMINRHGNWHLQVEDISKEQASEIRERSDVKAAGWFDEFNENASEPYYINNKKVALCGMDEEYITKITEKLSQGTFPKNDGEIMVGVNAKEMFGVQLGDRVTIKTPAGEVEYTISGFNEEDDEFQGQTYLMDAGMTLDAFQKLLDQNGVTDSSPAYFVQFQSAAKASRAKAEIQKQYGLDGDHISENLAVMGAAGSSDSTAMKGFYQTAVVLFILVLLAGVMMISGSMNSNVTRRTKFFGMMRCIGASRQQIMRFVRLEALAWCKTAVPLGVILGIVVSGGICALLRYGIGGEFAQTPVFAISGIGVVSGAAVGVVTVLLAARSPAKRAAKVSPIAAISGNTQNQQPARRVTVLPHTRIETSLGIHHAVSARKNWCLMTASFALSITLFLCFSVGMDLIRALLPSIRSWQPDCTINGYANALSLDKGEIDAIRKIPGVARVYGNSYISDIPVTSSEPSVDHVNLVSYDTYMLDCSADSVVKGELSQVYGDSDKVMTIYNKNNPLRVGDTIQLEDEELEVSCAVSDGLFSDELIVICSEETFTRLMGEQNYAMINVQLAKNATDKTVDQISAFAADDQIFTDAHENNRQSNDTYWVIRIVGYSFLIIIGMITVFYIINSISMSVSARVKQYGAMRAVGMDSWQLTKMIAAESFTYAVSGVVIGCAIGLPLSRALYTVLLTRHFGIEWTMPFGRIGMILLFVFAAALVAIYVPSKRIGNLAVTDAINEL
ncbi:MAG: FtsX-like permease family protein [Hespellia sp.]|nr:FtsX-like permease family protein [Hespellia sp.]